jgi:gliding motility-associated-like protein
MYNVSCNGYTDGSVMVNVSGGTNSYTYNWNNGAVTKDLMNVGAGAYSLSIVDQNGCSATVNVTLVEPAPILSAYTTQKPTCSGKNNGAITLLAGGGLSPYTFNWSNGVTSQDNLNIGAGSYTVLTTDKNGCQSQTVIKLSEPDVLAISRETKNIKCHKDTTGEIHCYPTGGTEPYVYNWSTGDSGESITSLHAGTYMVSVVDANGCQAIDTIELRQPDPLVLNVSSPVQFNGHNVSMPHGTDGSINVNVNGGVSPFNFQWSNNSTLQDQMNVAAGTYNVLCTDANGCRTAANITLTAPFELEMPTGFSPNSDGKNDMFVVHGIEAYPSNYLTVFNRWGNVVYSTAMYNNSWNGTNNEGQALPDATYFVLLEINGKEKVLKGYVEIRR